ncbi:divalent-cation tolerance protein CutA [[Eubacterium] cellulosolvens]
MKKTTDSRILSIIVLVTCPDEESANKIAVSLIEKKLAACVNTTDNVESIFRWKGKIEKSSERLLIIKSKKRLLKKLIADVQQNHPYQLPEILALPIIGGSKAYIDWLNDQTHGT